MSYWYVATPYSRYPGGHEAAFVAAASHTASLARAGLAVVSPVVATYPLVIHGGLRLTTFDEVFPLIGPMMDGTDGMIVVQLEGWDESFGISKERKIFTIGRKPIIDVPPQIVMENPERVVSICKALCGE